MMKEVDARGTVLSGTGDAYGRSLKSGNEPVRVLVTEPHQRMNVEKCAKDHGRTYTSEETEDGFAVVIG